MALADDPKKHILHMFKMAMHNRAERCEIFPEGVFIEGLPLTPGEQVYGAFRGKYFFSPEAFMWLVDGDAHRFEWKQVKSCARAHETRGGTVRATLVDGSRVAVPVREFATADGYDIGRLFFAMIDRWRAAVRDERNILTIERFFQLAKSDDAISPNWYPDHPGLERMRDWLEQLRTLPGIDEVLLVVTDYDDGQPCVQEVMFLSNAEPRGPEVERLNFSGIGESREKTVRLVGPIPPGIRAFSGIWD